jgi:hypothetical protein
MKLGKYLKQKGERNDAIEPIKRILNEMRDYINKAAGSMDCSQGLMSSLTWKEPSQGGQAPGGSIQQSLIQSKQLQPAQGSQPNPQNKDIIYIAAEALDIVEEKKGHQKLIAQSQAEFNQGGELERSDKVVIFPTYKTLPNGKPDYFSEDMSKRPRESYLEFGYDSANMIEENKHYRLVLNEPLEKTNYVSSGLFDKSPIFRGTQMASNDMWLANLFFKDEPYKEVGVFRGEVKLIEEKYLQDIMNLGLARECKKLQLPSSEHEWEQAAMDKDIIIDKKIRIVLYMVDAEIFSSADFIGTSDPYIVLKIGNTTVSDRDNYLSNCTSAKFYKKFV